LTLPLAVCIMSLMNNTIRTTDDARAAAIHFARAARLAPYNLTRRAWSYDALKASGCPRTLVKFCIARGISLAGVERAYRVAFDEAR
jgi:hypothetical protein